MAWLDSQIPVPTGVPAELQVVVQALSGQLPGTAPPGPPTARFLMRQAVALSSEGWVIRYRGHLVLDLPVPEEEPAEAWRRFAALVSAWPVPYRRIQPDPSGTLATVRLTVPGGRGNAAAAWAWRAIGAGLAPEAAVREALRRAERLRGSVWRWRYWLEWPGGVVPDVVARVLWDPHLAEAKGWRVDGLPVVVAEEDLERPIAHAGGRPWALVADVRIRALAPGAGVELVCVDRSSGRPGASRLLGAWPGEAALVAGSNRPCGGERRADDDETVAALGVRFGAAEPDGAAAAWRYGQRLLTQGALPKAVRKALAALSPADAAALAILERVT